MGVAYLVGHFDILINLAKRINFCFRIIIKQQYLFLLFTTDKLNLFSCDMNASH